MLIPRLNVAKFGDGWEEAAAKLGLCGPVCLEGIGAIGEVEKVKNVLRDVPVLVGPVAAKEVELITALLDNGALQVLVFGNIEEILNVAAQLPKERLVASFQEANLLSREDLEMLKAAVQSVIIDCPSTNVMKETAEKCWQVFGKIFPCGISLNVLEAAASAAADIDWAKASAMVGELHHLNKADHPIHIQSTQVIVPNASTEKIEKEEQCQKGFDMGSCVISCIKTDRPDGLFTTVVVDELGVALGLVYSSSDSIKASLDCGRAVYWSRSRNQLWRKGDTSGAFQDLVSISFDCDADALRFKVRQNGAPPSFCHQGFRTCWGEDKGLGHLVRTLKSRKENAPEKSYTKRLFNDQNLLRNKLLEESQEVIEAIEENDENHVTEEVADLAYFLFTACVAGGSDLEKVSNMLDLRSRKVKRRPGNAKDFRIQAAKEALDNIKK